MTITTTNRERNATVRRLGGLALIVTGIAADAALAARLLATPSAWPLLLHIPVVALWAAGWSLVRKNGNRAEVAVPVLAAALFPGLGPLGLTLGLFAGWIMVRRTGVALPSLYRKDAAVTLCRIDTVMQSQIDKARDLADSMQEAEHYANLADVCHRYAHSGLVDAVNGRYYLALSRDALRRAQHLEPDRTDLGRMLRDVSEELDGDRG
jgi:hypothetical protein